MDQRAIQSPQMNEDQWVGIAGIAMALVVTLGGLKEIALTREWLRRQDLSSEGVEKVDSTLSRVQEDYRWWPFSTTGSKR